MQSDRLHYALKHFFSEKFTYKTNLPVYELREDSPEGKSRLIVQVDSAESLCVANYDSLYDSLSKWGVLKTDKENRLGACIDHFILRENPDGIWELHMFEMKRSVGFNTWWDVKYKMRSSYLSIKALAVYLGINLDDSHITAYTTFETEKLQSLKTTAPMTRVPKVGERAIDVKKEEWDVGIINIPIIISDTNPYECRSVIRLRHSKIKMNFSEKTDTLESSILI